MALLDIFKKKKKKNSGTVTMLEQINKSILIIEQKARNLNESFSEEKNCIERIKKLAESIPERDEIFAAKLEQSILGDITTVSFACDKALAGVETSNVRSALEFLETELQQRKALEKK